MEHLLTISAAPGTGSEPCNEPLHLMAKTDVGAFEDEGYSERVTGVLYPVPDLLLQNVQAGEAIRAELGGQTYRFASLNRRGEFKLVKDDTAYRLVDVRG